jgi:uncharacterized protein (DUF1697 family)
VEHGQEFQLMIYIALLRGINVSGQKSIKMADLSKLCESLHFNNISTYLQSGNIIFKYDISDTSIIADKIKKAIRKKYGFDVDVIVRTAHELEKIISGNPLIQMPNIDAYKLHITFLQNHPQEQNVSTIEMAKEDNEVFVIKDREVYLYCPNGYGRTKLNNQAFEKKLKTPATTRNWKTAHALLEIAWGINK